MMLQGRSPEIRIVGSVVGAAIELNPPILRIEPGQKVVWSNHTTYDLQINFEPGDADPGRPSFIPKLSSVPSKFEKAGTYSYTLIYSSSKTFGRVTGTIVVGGESEESAPDKAPREREPEDDELRPKFPQEEHPGNEPFII